MARTIAGEGSTQITEGLLQHHMYVPAQPGPARNVKPQSKVFSVQPRRLLIVKSTSVIYFSATEKAVGNDVKL